MSINNDIGPVLVTGAGGFIGGHLVRYLSQQPGSTVIAATRDGREGTRRLDLRDPAGLGGALAGVTAIVHCAVGDRTVTVDGTRALLAAAAHAGVRRFVHISSIAVYGGATGRVVESTPRISASGRGYGAWKSAAEAVCLAQTGIETVRLRPAIVYGPGSTLWIQQLARRIRSGRWGVFGAAGEGTCNLIHVDDVVSAVNNALTASNVAGLAFNISGTEVMSWNTWFSRMAHALGAPPLRTISPVGLKARVLASLPLKVLARVTPGLASDWLLGSPARSELSLFALRASYPVDLASEKLGWRPEVTVDDGVAGSVRWLHEHVDRAMTH